MCPSVCSMVEPVVKAAMPMIMNKIKEMGPQLVSSLGPQLISSLGPQIMEQMGPSLLASMMG